MSFLGNELVVFTIIVIAYKKKERGADDECHESATETIKKGISRKWIVDREEGRRLKKCFQFYLN